MTQPDRSTEDDKEADNSVVGLKSAGVVGCPVEHSLSPLIHTTWARSQNLLYQYRAYNPGPNDAEFMELVKELNEAGVSGVNVTIPFKEVALKTADTATFAARQIGAANMLSFSDGKIIADNSDGVGFASSVKAALDGAGVKSALVLGAGGSAKAIAYALKNEIGATNILLSNRTKAKADMIASSVNGSTIAWEERDDVAPDVDLIVNTTSVGMNADDADEPVISVSATEAAVFDIVYAPLETPLLRHTRQAGLRTIDGLEMLVRQAVPGFLQWSGGAQPSIRDARMVCLETIKARQNG